MNQALNIAKYLIYKSYKLKKPITNLELQILLYTLQQKQAKVYNNTLFYDMIDISTLFPRVNNVYYYFAGFGAMPIEPATHILNKYKQTKKGLTQDCLDIINKTLPTFLNKPFYEKAKIYTAKNSIYNKAKINKQKEISPFDFLQEPLK